VSTEDPGAGNFSAFFSPDADTCPI
jgi:hypothetical protein